MEYIKTYIILYKSNTRVIYFSYMLNRTFILTGCREVSVYIQSVLPDWAGCGRITHWAGGQNLGCF